MSARAKERVAHTPEPWHAHVNVEGENSFTIYANKPGSQGRAEIPIASGRFTLSDKRVNAANLRLWIFAPDMLALLEEMLPYVESCIEEDAPEPCPASKDVARIKAVIARARAESDPPR